MNTKAWRLPALGPAWRWVGLALLLAAGMVLALLIPRPIVGTIYLNQPIEAFSAREVIAQIDEARTSRCARAVVLVLDSPAEQWPTRKRYISSWPGCVRPSPW
jgi:membrane-bound ClpP family serine protease